MLRSVAVIIAVALLVPVTASAANIAALKARLQELKSESAAAGRQYMKAYWALDETSVRLTKTNRRIKKTQSQLTEAKKQLNHRANSIYRRENLDFVGFLVGSASFEELVTRWDYMSRIGTADAEAVAKVKNLERRLIVQRTDLRTEQKKRSKDAAYLKKQRNRLQSRLAAKEAEYRQVKARLDASRAGGRLASGVVSSAGSNGMVFPVAGSNYYANTWGASRSGGRRRHQGTDIMARTGTPVVAVTSGTVSSKNGGLGGKVIWLRGGGWSFYYAHLDTWTVRSGPVRAGQVIGTVGATGNASGGSPHLHFQMHPGGGAPINPYSYLRAME